MQASIFQPSSLQSDLAMKGLSRHFGKIIERFYIVGADMSWGIAALVNEPRPLVFAFAAHYINLGAERVVLYLDKPDAALAEALMSLPKVEVVQCDAKFWGKFPFLRPFEPSWRQKVAAQDYYNRSKLDWVLHCDADEFLLPDPALFELLTEAAAGPEPVDFIRVNAVERMHRSADLRQYPSDDSIFGGIFRKPYPNNAFVEEMHGADAALMSGGLCGYAGGKSFHRTGRDLNVGIHTPLEEAKRPLIERPFGERILLHYDGLTPNSWISKIKRKLSQKDDIDGHVDELRILQDAAFLDANDDPAHQLAVYSRLKAVTPTQEAELEKRDLICAPQIDIEGVARRLYPEQPLDFSTAYFDTETLTAPKFERIDGYEDYNPAAQYQIFIQYRATRNTLYRFVPFALRGTGIVRRLRALIGR
jgi:hypothetical protein